MTLFIQLEAGQPIGYPIAETNFRQLFPNVSFPTYFTPESVEPFGYGIYDFSNPPVPGRYQKVVEVTPVRNQYGIWIQTYTLAPMDEPEKQAADAAQGALVRADRNARLAASDWTQLPDAPVDHVPWAAYRAQLRDVTDQPGFPWNVQWPTQPTA